MSTHPGHVPPQPFPTVKPRTRSMSQEWKFDLAQLVAITESGECGKVIGRAEYSTTAIRSYLVRYRSGKGSAVEVWWTEDALEPERPLNPVLPAEDRGVKRVA